MRIISVEQIIRDEWNVQFSPKDSFLLSYREFVTYFATREVLTTHDLIIGAHFTYGWMPTILHIHSRKPEEDFPTAVAILNDVKRGSLIGENELLFLKGIINNSLVGPSKLLHFINPKSYAIWDSNVCGYINGKAYSYQVSNVQNYLGYLDNCREITLNPRFEQVHASMNRKIGYDVTPYRALELVMFKTGAGSR